MHYLASLALASSATCALASAQADTYTFFGETPQDWLGGSVAAAGDVDGDGIGDFVVGAPMADHGLPRSGSVYVYSGADGSLLQRWDGHAAEANLGVSVAGEVDVNGDGYADIIAGSSRLPGPGQNGQGRVQVYSGFDGSVLYTYSEPGDDTMGYAVDGIGDLNGDGFDEYMAGSPDGGVGQGKAIVFSGSDGSVLYTYTAAAGLEHLGYDVAGVRDTNGDGVADFAVGVYGEDFAGINRGSVRLHSGADGSVLMILRGNSPFDLFGVSVADAGDVDGDGLGDLIVGSNRDGASTIPGTRRADVFSGFDGTHLHAFTGAGFDSAFVLLQSPAVSGAGDVDGDGACDLAVGRGYDSGSGAVRILSGLDGSLLFSIYGDQGADQMGYSVAGVGDVDGNGLDDVLVGSRWDDNFLQNAGKAILVGSGRYLGSLFCTPANVHSGGRAAILHAQGNANLVDNNLVLVADRLPFDEFGFFVIGSAMGTPQVPMGSQGSLCLGGSLGRFASPGQVQDSGPWGSFRLRVQNTNVPLGSAVVALQSGETWHFQAWFRDNNPGPTSNFTDALAITFQ